MEKTSSAIYLKISFFTILKVPFYRKTTFEIYPRIPKNNNWLYLTTKRVPP